MTHLIMNSSIIVFMLGLIAEQIASLRLERGDKVFEAEDVEQYRVFSSGETHTKAQPEHRVN